MTLQFTLIKQFGGGSFLRGQHCTVLGASDLGQNPKGSGLRGAGPGTPVLCVLSDALPAGVGMSGYVVKMDVCVHNVSPGNSGRTCKSFYRLLQTQHRIKSLAYGVTF